MKNLLIGMFCGVLTTGIGLAQTSPTQSNPTPNESVQGKPVPDKPETVTQGSSSQSGAEIGSTPPASSTPSSSVPKSSTAQNGAAPNSPIKRLASGSVIPVVLAKTIDARKAKNGDEVVAKVAQDLKTNDGQLIIAKDTKVVGHVTQVQASSKEKKESEVAIAFDHTVTKEGNAMQIPMSIQAVIGPENSNSPSQSQNPGQSKNNDSSANSGSSMPASSMGSGGSGSGSGSRGGGSAPAAAPSQIGSSQPSSGGGESNEANEKSDGRPHITSQTQGVMGFSDLKLDAGSAPAQGSMLTSEKKNVKLDSGTMMLLRVQ